MTTLNTFETSATATIKNLKCKDATKSAILSNATARLASSKNMSKRA